MSEINLASSTKLVIDEVAYDVMSKSISKKALLVISNMLIQQQELVNSSAAMTDALTQLQTILMRREKTKDVLQKAAVKVLRLWWVQLSDPTRVQETFGITRDMTRARTSAMGGSVRSSITVPVGIAAGITDKGAAGGDLQATRQKLAEVQERYMDFMTNNNFSKQEVRYCQQQLHGLNEKVETLVLKHEGQLLQTRLGNTDKSYEKAVGKLLELKNTLAQCNPAGNPNPEGPPALEGGFEFGGIEGGIEVNRINSEDERNKKFINEINAIDERHAQENQTVEKQHKERNETLKQGPNADGRTYTIEEVRTDTNNGTDSFNSLVEQEIKKKEEQETGFSSLVKQIKQEIKEEEEQETRQQQQQQQLEQASVFNPYSGYATLEQASNSSWTEEGAAVFNPNFPYATL